MSRDAIWRYSYFEILRSVTLLQFTHLFQHMEGTDVFVKYVDRLVKCCVKGDEFLTVTI